ncbi:MAG: FAD-binding oxidoreductase [Ignavibacteria bacterium]|nr:FAD-binding oxidoreductase [Ignavibacteria bacterium]
MIIKYNPEEIQAYLTDASNLFGNCEKVYIPENLEELSNCINELYHNNTPYTISGGGTGLVGGRVPFEGVVISMEKLDKVIDINPEEKWVFLQCGCTYQNLEDSLSEFNLFLPPNPTEKNSFIGGNLACNASGSRTFKYGTIRNFVLELSVVLPNGELLNLKRDNNYKVTSKFSLLTPNQTKIEFPIPKIPYPKIDKNTAGYYLFPGMDFLDIFIGSEGTLGIIVATKLKIYSKPESVIGLIIFFDDLNRAFDFISATRTESIKSFQASQKNIGISARLIEFFDKNSLSLLRNDYPQILNNIACAIWVEQEYKVEQEQEILNLWLENISEFTKLSDSTWVALTEKEHNRLREFRHKIPLKVFEIVAKSKFSKIGSDVSVPNQYFRNFYFEILDRLESSNLQYFIWGHFGNSHIHLNIIPETELENTLAKQIYDEHIEKAINIGGTYSAEHGTGKLKKKYLEKMYGKRIVEEMKRIKKIFDPKDLIGRGNLFL